MVGVENTGIIVNAFADVSRVCLCCQSREHQAVLCASGAISGLASLLSLSTGNEKVSRLYCMLATLCLFCSSEKD